VSDATDTVEGCGGQCCAVFYFPRTPQEIRQAIEDHGEFNGLDGMMLADMLVPLTPEQVDERIERFGLNAWAEAERRPKKLFTCKHWDEETKLCTVYDYRPRMCAKFPYGQECPHCKCVGGSAYGRTKP